MPSPSGASGFFFPQLGARASGMGASFVALADDPSCVFHNPAGLVLVPGSTLQLSLHALWPQVTYTRQDGPVQFEPAHLEDPFSPLPLVAYSWRDRSRRYALGAAVYPAWGARLHYDPRGAQRYQVHRQDFFNVHTRWPAPSGPCPAWRSAPTSRSSTPS